MTKARMWLFFAVAAGLLSFTMVFTASGDDIKNRMLERLPTINALKGQGIIGENNQGLLEYRRAANTQKELVEGENRDRRAVYGMIAGRQKVKVDQVAKQRAAQIAGREPAGHWVQNPNGQWYRK